MRVGELQTLFSYNTWANDRIFEAVGALAPEAYLRDLGSSHGGVHGTLVHLVGAEDIWLERWNGTSPAVFYSARDFASFDAVRERRGRIDAALEAYVGSMAADEEAARVVSYKDLKGNPHAEPLWQLMQHLANHSTYHRGQVVTMLRQLGSPAPSTDLIAYYRLHPHS
jgi:uncharacterized damage-inducible protein DinB